MDIEQTYNDTPYRSFAFSQSSPHRLEAAARLLGINAANSKTSKVLEIGSSFGGNLIPFAVQNKDATLLGIDLSSQQISKGNKIISEIGLKNITLKHMDVCDFSKNHDGDKFDYIIVHGVFSWVPPFVKEAILSTIRHHLTPNGIAYISYNVYPGWKQKDTIKELMSIAYAKNRDLKFVKELLKLYANFLKTKLDTSTNLSIYSPHALIYYIEEILYVKRDDYVLHEWLESFNEPMFFHDFAGLLDKHSLSYMCESDLLDITDPKTGYAPLDEFINKHFNTKIEAESILDIAQNRPFRSSLITHKALNNSLSGKQIAPSDIKKINIIANFIKTKNGYTNVANAKMPSGFEWLYEIFANIYPASLNLGELLSLLSQNQRLEAYAGILNILLALKDNSVQISSHKFENIAYEVGKSCIKPEVLGYIKHFKNNKNSPISLANELGIMQELMPIECVIAPLFDGKNSKQDIAKALLKEAKKMKIPLYGDKNSKIDKEKIAMAYVNDLERILSCLYFFKKYKRRKHET